MNRGLIPRRYAKALYQVGAERNENAGLYMLMQRLTAAFTAEPKLQAAVANPFVPAADKVRLVSAAAGEVDKPALFGDFLQLLQRNGRFDMIRDVAHAFEELYRASNRIFKVSIISAAELSMEVRGRMTDLLRRHIGEGTLECSFEVDNKLIGGFKVLLGNELLDATVATQLNRIRLDLIK